MASLERMTFFLNAIETHNNGHLQIQKTCMIPCSTLPHVTPSNEKFPFSLQMMLTCYLRVLHRHEHMTLTSENPELACRVIFGFFNSFRGASFDKAFSEKFEIDQFIHVNLASESGDIELPSNLVRAADACLVKCQKYPATPQREPEFEAFCDLVDKYRAFFGRPQRGKASDDEMIDSLKEQMHNFMP